MIVSVINLKGGVGKTTTAMALATQAAREGVPTVVLDADSQSSASLWQYNAAQGGSPLGFEVRSANMADLLRLRDEGRDGLVVVDTPPTGNVTDMAKDMADFVVVPTGTSGIDLQQTGAVVDVLEAAGRPYAVLMVRVEANTLAARAAREYLASRQASVFEAEIPKRSDLSNAYGQRFASNLHGYEDVWHELKEAMR